MRVVTIPTNKPVKKRRRHLRKWFLLLVPLSATAILYFRPLPPATVFITVPKEISSPSSTIAWPNGQTAFSAAGFDFLESNQKKERISTASIAKVITALCILEKMPLAQGQSGPTYTISSADVKRYQDEVARDGTTFAVSEGDTLTEYEMLEAILLPSANNISDTAAIWAFGSLEAYRTNALVFLEKNGMKETTIGSDASGYDPATTSTPSDLVKLAKLALNNPVVMEIAGKPTSVIGDGVQIFNHNTIVGKGGVTGLKTGRNDENSGALLFTAKVGEGGNTVDLAGVVANAGSLYAALAETARLVDSLADDFPTSVIASKNEKVGTARTAWGEEQDIVSVGDLSLRHWSGSTVYSYHDVGTISGTEKEPIGLLSAKADGKKVSVKLKISTPSKGPGLLWRITHLR